ncbi:hypothetical protein [Micromonospora carbonacea]|uniref:Uncharacterized protein n=1 Tax=Micromonospora carbonacea TaxID=47853 RepID=A0A7H8XNL9_9ACTN|nr:hypothetical protein [Micromonospora carbonacea]MBB5825354.1 hypothetical protein [Micromonospora carbonacea]QLD26583.1 hypothetical protein HXZ27_22150 [Micromonospora carbonacea]
MENSPGPTPRPARPTHPRAEGPARSTATLPLVVAPVRGRRGDRGPAAHRARPGRGSRGRGGRGGGDGDGPAGRRRTAVVVLGVVAAAAAAALVVGLLTWVPAAPEPSRPLTPAEAERLAAVRVTNHRDVRSGVRLTVGEAGARTDVVGWVDWSRPLAYLDVGGPGAGPDRGLVQAVPGLLLTRPDPTAVPAPAYPPLVPPADGWRVGDVAAARPLRPAVDLLLALAAPRPEPAGDFPADDARWLAPAEAGGLPVDVFQSRLPGPTPGPVPGSVTPTTGRRSASTAAGRSAPTTARQGAPGKPGRSTPAGSGPAASTPGASGPAGSWPGPAISLPAAVRPPAGPALDGAARWWVDRDARLHRLEGRLRGGVPVTLELQRANRPVLWPVAALGGRAGLPRALTGAEEDRLARVATRLRAQGGAAATLTAPVAPGRAVRGTGWLDWTARAAYLSVGGTGAWPGRTLRRYDAAGVWSAAATGDPTAPPPLPPPRTGYAWHHRPPGADGADDIDLLLAAALRAGAATKRTARPASRIRGDRLADRAVDVIEVDAGRGPLRYWIDRSGLLRRLELRTRLGTYAQLDLSPEAVPALPPVAPARAPR